MEIFFQDVMEENFRNVLDKISVTPWKNYFVDIFRDDFVFQGYLLQVLTGAGALCLLLQNLTALLTACRDRF